MIKVKLVEEIVTHIDKAFVNSKIRIEDYNEFDIILENLFDYLNDKLDRTGEIEKGVQQLVKTFYDKRVEERGIEKGLERGMEKGKEEKREFIKNLLRSGVSKQTIMASGNIAEEEIDKIIMDTKN